MNGPVGADEKRRRSTGQLLHGAAADFEEDRDQEDDREERPRLVQEAREGREARELAVRPTEEAKELVQAAVGAEDLREQRPGEDEDDGEVHAPGTSQAPQREEAGHAGDQARDASGAQPFLREVRL